MVVMLSGISTFVRLVRPERELRLCEGDQCRVIGDAERESRIGVGFVVARCKKGNLTYNFGIAIEIGIEK